MRACKLPAVTHPARCALRFDPRLSQTSALCKARFFPAPRRAARTSPRGGAPRGASSRSSWCSPGSCSRAGEELSRAPDRDLPRKALSLEFLPVRAALVAAMADRFPLIEGPTLHAGADARAPPPRGALLTGTKPSNTRDPEDAQRRHRGRRRRDHRAGRNSSRSVGVTAALIWIDPAPRPIPGWPRGGLDRRRRGPTRLADRRLARSSTLLCSRRAAPTPVLALREPDAGRGTTVGLSRTPPARLRISLLRPAVATRRGEYRDRGGQFRLRARRRRFEHRPRTRPAPTPAFLYGHRRADALVGPRFTWRGRKQMIPVRSRPHP
jgi:hypothetical protein